MRNKTRKTHNVLKRPRTVCCVGFLYFSHLPVSFSFCSFLLSFFVLSRKGTYKNISNTNRAAKQRRPAPTSVWVHGMIIGLVRQSHVARPTNARPCELPPYHGHSMQSEMHLLEDVPRSLFNLGLQANHRQPRLCCLHPGFFSLLFDDVFSSYHNFIFAASDCILVCCNAFRSRERRSVQ